MKTWFVFNVTNFFGFTERVSVWANNTDEALELVLAKISYEPTHIEYVGNACYNLELQDEEYNGRMFVCRKGVL